MAIVQSTATVMGIATPNRDNRSIATRVVVPVSITVALDLQLRKESLLQR
uniref:Uncharacterized protein n=1 Tax=Solanum lycopersicum TaxID=4081 RepID=A0A3Q7GQH3_SOLLC